MNMDNEIWKSMPNYEGLYEVSNFGRVRAVERVISGRQYPERLLSPSPDKNGYIRVRLCRARDIKRVLVHRIVAFAFIPNPDNKPYIDHIDGSRNNNKAENLHWVTHKENLNNPITKQRFRVSNRANKFTEVARQKSKEVVQKGVLMLDKNTSEILASFQSISEAYKATGIAISSISAVCNNKRNSAGGFRWRFNQ